MFKLMSMRLIVFVKHKTEGDPKRYYVKMFNKTELRNRVKIKDVLKCE